MPEDLGELHSTDVVERRRQIPAAVLATFDVSVTVLAVQLGLRLGALDVGELFHLRTLASNSLYGRSKASMNNSHAPRCNVSGARRGFAANWPINSDCATPTCPVLAADAHSGSRSCMRAVCTRR